MSWSGATAHKLEEGATRVLRCGRDEPLIPGSPYSTRPITEAEIDLCTEWDAAYLCPSASKLLKDIKRKLLARCSEFEPASELGLLPDEPDSFGFVGFAPLVVTHLGQPKLCLPSAADTTKHSFGPINLDRIVEDAALGLPGADCTRVFHATFLNGRTELQRRFEMARLMAVSELGLRLVPASQRGAKEDAVKANPDAFRLEMWMQVTRMGAMQSLKFPGRLFLPVARRLYAIRDAAYTHDSANDVYVEAVSFLAMTLACEGDLNGAKKILKEGFPGGRNSGNEKAFAVVENHARGCGRTFEQVFMQGKKLKKECKEKLKQDRGDMSGVCIACDRMYPQNEMKKCGRCKIAIYCSETCQKASWKNGHKAACPDMAKEKDDLTKRRAAVAHFNQTCTTLHGLDGDLAELNGRLAVVLAFEPSSLRFTVQVLAIRADGTDDGVPGPRVTVPQFNVRPGWG